MKVMIDEILAKQHKTRYWLAKECNCHYVNLCNLCSGNAKMVSFELLEKICYCLNVELSDILQIEE